MRSKRTSTGTSSGATACTRSATPIVAELVAVRARALALTSMAHTVAAGARWALTHAIGPHPQPRSSTVVSWAESEGASLRRNLVPGARRAARSFRDATRMLRREVADRVVASPCSRAYGPLAILTRLTADARRVLSLPPGAFRPPPRVRAAVVTLDFRPPSISIADPALFERMVRSLFTHRRKTLLNALAPFAGIVSALPPRELLDRAGLASDRRPETLDLEDLAVLAETLAGR